MLGVLVSAVWFVVPWVVIVAFAAFALGGMVAAVVNDRKDREADR